MTLDISHPYGCHNRPDFVQVFFAQDGWRVEGRARVAKIAVIPNRMAQDCRYTLTELGQTDPRCVGCKHRRDGLDKPQGL